VRLKVLILDDNFTDLNGDMLPENASIEVNDTICIFQDFKGDLPNLLGNATVVKEGSELFIENIDMFQENMKAYRYLTPIVECVIKNKEGNRITSFEIRSVSFCSVINSDERIKTIGEQLYGKGV